MKRSNILTKYEPPTKTNISAQVNPKDTNHQIENFTVVLNHNNHEFHKTVIPNYRFSQEREQGSVEGRYEITGTFNIWAMVGPVRRNDSDRNCVSILGGVFLSQKYLLVERKTFGLALTKRSKDEAKIVTVWYSTSEVEVTITAKGPISGIIIVGLVLATNATAGYYGRKWWNRKTALTSSRHLPDCEGVWKVPRRENGQGQYELEVIPQPRSELPEGSLVQ